MKKFTILNFICFSVLALAVSTYPQQLISSVAHTRHVINSAALGEERSILVRVPFGYERSTQRFPVAVMLDAHAPANAMLASIVESQAFAGTMPEMIVVGIQNTNRTRDMTPTKTERAGSGGADKFLDFIEKEVLTFVDKNYRTEPYRVFAGHSLGGLAVIYAMATRPNVFGGYIAASPVLHWDKNFVINKSEEFFKTKADMKRSIFISLGDEPTYTDGFNAYKDLVKRSAPSGFEIEMNHWTDEDHGSIVMRTYLAGMRKTFTGWRPSANLENIAALRSHYSKLSKRFGYEVKPPENTINQFAYALLRADRIDEAIEGFEENVRLYAESANVYDSLAEALEKKGAKNKALANYEKAYKMAEQKGETQLAQSAKANFERLKNAN